MRDTIVMMVIRMFRIQCLLREIFGPAVTKVVVVVAEEQSGGRVGNLG